MWKLRNHRRWLFGKMFRITVVVQDFWRNMCLSSYYGKQIFGLWWTLLVILDMIHWTLWVLGVIIRSPFLVSTTRRNAGQLGHGLASTFQRYVNIIAYPRPNLMLVWLATVRKKGLNKNAILLRYQIWIATLQAASIFTCISWHII